MNKTNRNLTSLIIGITLILIGLFYGGVTITFTNPNYIPPSIVLIVGIILTLLGAFRAWWNIKMPILNNQDFSKELTKLSNKYQTYVAYINTVLTVAISFFIAMFSYIITTIDSFKNNPSKTILVGVIFISLEIAFIAVIFYFKNNKKEIDKQIDNLKTDSELRTGSAIIQGNTTSITYYQDSKSKPEDINKLSSSKNLGNK